MLGQSNFYRAVRQFAVTTPVWGEAIRYHTLNDEVYDLTLISRRVYGNPDEWMAVMAAAGLDRLDQPLTERELVLPTPSQLYVLKVNTGYQIAQLPKVR